MEDNPSVFEELLDSEAFSKGLLKEDPLKTIAAFLYILKASREDLRKFIDRCQENPSLGPRLELLLRGETRKWKLSDGSGVITVPFLEHHDKLITAGKEVYLVEMYCGKSTLTDRDEHKILIKHEKSGSTKTIACLKTSEGLKIYGFNKFVPRTELDL